MTDLRDEIVFKVWDKNLLYDAPIGFASVKLSSLCCNKGGKLKFDLLFGFEERGWLSITTKFKPAHSLVEDVTEDPLEKSLKNELRFLQVDVQGCQEKIKTLETEIKAKRKQKRAKEEKLLSSQKTLLQFKTIQQSFGKSKKVKTDFDSRTLCPLILDTESTMLEVSDYLKDGGVQRTEWPWKVMMDSEAPSDKWICKQETGWISYQFDKPILIRGYGLKSANDEPGRDPNIFKVYIKDALTMKKKEATKALDRGIDEILEEDEPDDDQEEGTWEVISS